MRQTTTKERSEIRSRVHNPCSGIRWRAGSINWIESKARGYLSAVSEAVGPVMTGGVCSILDYIH